MRIFRLKCAGRRGDGLVTGGTVGHGPGDDGDFGDPAAVLFAFDLNFHWGKFRQREWGSQMGWWECFAGDGRSGASPVEVEVEVEVEGERPAGTLAP